MNRRRWLVLSYILTLIILLLSACGGAPASGTSVWIDVPLNGLRFPDLQEIQVEGHAASAGGISRVEIWVNGVLLTTINNPPTDGTLANFHAMWMPAVPGEYTIQAVAFGRDGAASQPDAARVTFGEVPVTPPVGCPSPVGGGPTPISCSPVVVGCPSPVGGGPTPVSCGPAVIGCPSPVGGGPTPGICPTDTATSPPPHGSKVVQFLADPAQIEAGACTTMRWHVENVQKVIFGGIEQPFDGSYKDCLCQNQRYTLTVVNQDGTEEKHRVDIAVNGSCAAPDPDDSDNPPDSGSSGDSSAPPVPTPARPGDGETLSCSSTQTLAWSPVTDDSQPVQYYVKLEISVKKGQWQPTGGYGPLTDTQVNVPVVCGGIYRWMVRAEDGAGNVSSWSSLSRFSVNLD